MALMEGDFSEWLEGELKTRGWSDSELARRAGVSHASISYVAKAFRFAGLLPSHPVKNLRDNLLEVFDALGDDEQREIFRLARMMRICRELEAESKEP
jgi:transcriptional regulator with XRE-family HTH domain